jgi:hypothetical protein
MWRILKSELLYNLNVSFWALLFFLFMFLFYFFSGTGYVQVYVAMTAMLIAPMIGGYALDFRAKQRRDYFFSKLTVPIRHLAFIRLIYTVGLWLVTVALFWLIILFFSMVRAAALWERVNFNWFHAPSAMNFFWLNGWILLVNACYLIVTDKKAEAPEGPIAFVYEGLKYVIPLAAMSPLYLAFFIGELTKNPVMTQFFRQFISGTAGVILVNILGVTVSLLSIRVFSIRGSYAHS